MTRTGIFFHYQQGRRLQDFPQALGDLLEKDNVCLYDALYPGKPPSASDLDPIGEKTLLKVHVPEMLERVKATGDYEGALYSVSGTVAAGLKIWAGEITNAFVFTGYGDHHAGRDFFGGGCYFNSAAITIRELRNRFGAKRFAVIDTDPHHGDGSWDIFQEDPQVLYLCFCAGRAHAENHNVEIHVPFRSDDAAYLKLADEALEIWVRPFAPEAVFWNWGYDGTVGEYGDIGLTAHVHRQLAHRIRKLADEVCKGRLVVVLCGGSRRDLARQIIPEIVEALAI